MVYSLRFLRCVCVCSEVHPFVRSALQKEELRFIVCCCHQVINCSVQTADTQLPACPVRIKVTGQFVTVETEIIHSSTTLDIATVTAPTGFGLHSTD